MQGRVTTVLLMNGVTRTSPACSAVLGDCHVLGTVVASVVVGIVPVGVPLVTARTLISLNLPIQSSQLNNLV